MKTESEIPDNQENKSESFSPLFRESSTVNYIIAIITSVIYVLAVHSSAIISDMMFLGFITTVIGTLGIPAIFAGIYCLVKRKGFSKVFAWATVILCVMSYFGRAME